MKIPPLLFTSLASSLALVAAVTVFIQEKPDRLPATQAPTTLSPTEITEPSPEPTRIAAVRETTTVSSEHPASTSPAVIHARNAEPNAASSPTEIKRLIPLSNSERASLTDLDHAANEAAGQVANRNRISRGALNWVNPPQSTGLPGAKASPAQTGPIPNGKLAAQGNTSSPPAVKLPDLVAETRAAQSPPLSDRADLTPASTTASASASATRSRPPWPRGPFTPEEEMYRAQFGEAALSATLRDESLGTAKP